MENNQLTQEVVETAANTAIENGMVPESTEAETLQKNMDEAQKISQFRLKSLSQLIGIYLDTFSAEMIATNGKTYNEKVQAAKALKEGVLFALDFGLGITKANIREKGRLSKEVNGLAGTLVQALDTRFILLADNMRRLEEAQASAQTEAVTDTVTETTEENKETTNG